MTAIGRQRTHRTTAKPKKSGKRKRTRATKLYYCPELKRGVKRTGEGAAGPPQLEGEENLVEKSSRNLSPHLGHRSQQCGMGKQLRLGLDFREGEKDSPEKEKKKGGSEKSKDGPNGSDPEDRGILEKKGGGRGGGGGGALSAGQRRADEGDPLLPKKPQRDRTRGRVTAGPSCNSMPLIPNRGKRP